MIVDSSWFQAIDVPLVMFNSDMLKIMVDSIRYSMRSIGTVGILGLGVIFSAGLIVRFFNEHWGNQMKIDAGVKKKMFRRVVDNADMERNGNDIAENSLFKREIEHLTDLLWRKKHEDWDIDNAVYRKKIDAKANAVLREDGEKYDLDVDNGVYRIVISRDAHAKYKRNMDEYYRKKDGSRSVACEDDSTGLAVRSTGLATGRRYRVEGGRKKLTGSI